MKSAELPLRLYKTKKQPVPQVPVVFCSNKFVQKPLIQNWFVQKSLMQNWFVQKSPIQNKFVQKPLILKIGLFKSLLFKGLCSAECFLSATVGRLFIGTGLSLAVMATGNTAHIINLQLFCRQIPIGFQQFCHEHGASGSTANGVVGEAYELIVENGILS